MITLGPKHFREAKPALMVALVLGALVSFVLVLGGIYMAAQPASTQSVLKLWGGELTSGNAGLIMVLIGMLALVVTIRSFWKTTVRLMEIPDKPAASGLPRAPKQSGD
jgi:hypothetical protein